MTPPRKPSRQWLNLLIILLVTVAALYLVLVGTGPGKPTNPSTAPATSQPAAADISPGALYAASFPGLDDQPQPLGKWQGKVVVLNFWATWCVPCLEEMPIFDRVHQQIIDKGGLVVGLAADDKPKVAQFLKEHPVSYPILIGDFEALEFARRLGNKQAALPFTAIIDRAGRVLRVKLGPYTQAELEAAVVSAL